MTVSISLTEPENYFEWAEENHEIMDNHIHMIGFGFDGTACFRKGAKEGPDALRAVAGDIESWSPYLERDLEDISFVDLGNLNMLPYPPKEEAETEEGHQAIEKAWQQASDDFLTLFRPVDLQNKNIKIMTLGGEHSISYAPIKTYLEAFPDLYLIHLDAHADLRDGYLDYHYSHASIIRRVLDHFGPNHNLLQYGIRSGTREEYQWMKANETLAQSRATFLQAIRDIPADRPIYLTFDLDYFDPSYFPGTGTPEPGGEDFHSFISLCKILKEKNFVGCDVVELAPVIDPTGNSDVMAAKVVRELLLCLAE